MRYNATLHRRHHIAPLISILELEIPDHLTDDQRAVFAAHKLMKQFRIELDPVPEEELAELILMEMGE